MSEKRPYPCLTVDRQQISFNAAASKLIKTPYLFIQEAGDLILFLPATNSMGHKVGWKKNEPRACVTCRELVNNHGLRKGGHYKLYKYRNGFAIRRYEPLEE